MAAVAAVADWLRRHWFKGRRRRHLKVGTFHRSHKYKTYAITGGYTAKTPNPPLHNAAFCVSPHGFKITQVGCKIGTYVPILDFDELGHRGGSVPKKYRGRSSDRPRCFLQTDLAVEGCG